MGADSCIRSAACRGSSRSCCSVRCSSRWAPRSHTTRIDRPDKGRTHRATHRSTHRRRLSPPPRPSGRSCCQDRSGTPPRTRPLDVEFVTDTTMVTARRGLVDELGAFTSYVKSYGIAGDRVGRAPGPGGPVVDADTLANRLAQRTTVTRGASRPVPRAGHGRSRRTTDSSSCSPPGPRSGKASALDHGDVADRVAGFPSSDDEDSRRHARFGIYRNRSRDRPATHRCRCRSPGCTRRSARTRRGSRRPEPNGLRDGLARRPDSEPIPFGIGAGASDDRTIRRSDRESVRAIWSRRTAQADRGEVAKGCRVDAGHERRHTRGRSVRRADGPLVRGRDPSGTA